jgi:hypothetical protein
MDRLMDIYRFDSTTGRQVTRFGSAFSITHLLRLEAAPAQISCARLGQNGRIGLHPAAAPQLLLVVEGAGWVRGDAAEPVPIAAGQAAFWIGGEEHETWTEGGLVAVIVEGPGVEPGRFMLPAVQV